MVDVVFSPSGDALPRLDLLCYAYLCSILVASSRSGAYRPCGPLAAEPFIPEPPCQRHLAPPSAVDDEVVALVNPKPPGSCLHQISEPLMCLLTFFSPLPLCSLPVPSAFRRCHGTLSPASFPAALQTPSALADQPVTPPCSRTVHSSP